jgi:hypothetical protein
MTASAHGNLEWLRVPAALRPVAGEIVAITDRSCAECLDAEYAELCRGLVARLARRRPSPLVRGDTRIWAAGSIYVVGQINFLFDPSELPHLSADQLAKHLGVVKTSMANNDDGPTKSGKVRSVPLVAQAARALDRLSRRERWTGDDDRVFVNDVGEQFEDSAMRRRFYTALDAAGIPHIRFHDLRHTFGTIAVQAFPLTDVKAFMGHADIQTTMIYVHHVPKHDAADRLTRLLDDQIADNDSAESGCTPGARAPSDREREIAETLDLLGVPDAGGETRTPDTRIMIPLL